MEGHVVVDESGTAVQSAIEAAEIDVEIFDFRGPVPRQCRFQSGANRPAGLVAAGVRQAGRRGTDIAERAATGDERHEAIRGVAEPSAHRGQPIVAGLAAERTQIVGRAVDAGPVDIALDAGNDLAELIIIAGGAADRAAADVPVAC